MSLSSGRSAGVTFRAPICLHVIEQPAHEVGDEIDAERPACAEIAEHPDQVGHAGEHHAAIGDGIAEHQRLPVDDDIDIAEHAEMKAGRRDDDVGGERLAGFEQDAGPGEAVDLVGHHGRLARLDAVKQIAIRHERDALPPWPVARREVRIHVVIGAEDRADRTEQFLLHCLGLAERALREYRLLIGDLAPDDLVDPRFVDLQSAQLLGDLDGVAAGAEKRRRALQHGDVGALIRDGRNQRRGGRAGADHDDALSLIVEVLGPKLRVHDAAFVIREALPLRRVALRVAVIALARPKEIRSEPEPLPGVGANRIDGPEAFRARPRRRQDRVPIADVRTEIVLLDHVTHVRQDFFRGRDRRRGPRFEAIAEGMQVAVGADAGIAMGQPRPAKAVLRLQRHERRARALLRQMIRGAHARDAGADDEDIEMLGNLGGGGADLGVDVHGGLLVWMAGGVGPQAIEWGPGRATLALKPTTCGSSGRPTSLQHDRDLHAVRRV